MATNIADQNGVSELLYHVLRTIIDFARDKSGATQTTDVFGTFTDLAAAKAAARSVLPSEGYSKEDFTQYEENDGTKEWKYREGGMVFAKALSGEEFQVYLDTKPNLLRFKGNASGKVEGHLHYVLQTTIYYNKDSTGGVQTTEVEGTYPTRKAAREAAKTTLLDDEVTKESFAQYDEIDAEKDDWPYGEDVWVHAVAETGENFKVSVKAQPHSHPHHESRNHGDKEV